MISSGIGEQLNFNPGAYSVDLDADDFNASVRADLFHLSHCLLPWNERTGRMSTTVESMVWLIFRSREDNC